MLTMTYVMQAFAAMLACGASILLVFAFSEGRWPFVALNLVVIVINVGLFFWQASIRASMLA